MSSFTPAGQKVHRSKEETKDDEKSGSSVEELAEGISGMARKGESLRNQIRPRAGPVILEPRPTRHEPKKATSLLQLLRKNLEKPNIDTPETIEKKRKVAEKEGDLLASIGQLTCSGEDCCDEGTAWDSEKMLCVPIEENFDNIRPNEPNNKFAKL